MAERKRKNAHRGDRREFNFLLLKNGLRSE
jgi:hypothetical protein